MTITNAVPLNCIARLLCGFKACLDERVWALRLENTGSIATMHQSIVQRRNNIAAYLRRTLGDDFVVVASPDHPLVMRSVDVLVGGRAGLTAVVIASAEELQRPRFLNARVALNMVALPPNANFIFVSKGGSEKISRSSFVAVISQDDQRWQEELARLVSNPQRFTRRRSAEETQKRSESRFADTYRLARALDRWSRDKSDQGHLRPSRSSKRDKIVHGIDAVFYSGTPSVPALTHLTWEGAERWFDSSSGEPVPNNLSAGAAFVDGYPQSPGDPDKVLRAAAFAGWVLAPAHSSQSTAQVGDLLFRYTRLK